MMARWMRRRIARHVDRGTSERVIACLISPLPGSAPRQGNANMVVAALPPQADTSNVILFRALARQGGKGGVVAF